MQQIRNRKENFKFCFNSELFPSSFAGWNFLNANKVITGTADARVEAVEQNKIGSRKIFKFFRAKEYLNGYQWEYKLIDDKQINAWCMPGGKIVVYSGILP
jgi:Zn-dependent protease with chaperone function